MVFKLQLSRQVSKRLSRRIAEAADTRLKVWPEQRYDLIAVAHERHGFRGDTGLLELNHHHFSLRPVNITAGVLIATIFMRPRVAARSLMSGETLCDAGSPCADAKRSSRLIGSALGCWVSAYVVQSGEWPLRVQRPLYIGELIATIQRVRL
jgi:hypothetical protein